MFEVDEEGLEDAFDLLIVAGLTDDEPRKERPKKAYIDQVNLF